MFLGIIRCIIDISSKSRLASADVKSKRARVIVLEELESKTAGRGKLKADGGTGWALVGADDVGVARLEAADGTVLESLRWLVGVCGALVGGAGQNVRNKTTLTVEAVRASLELVQLWEQEDEGASLAGVRGRNVKVEDGRDGAVDSAVVLSAVSGVWRARRDWHDQVRVLVVTVDVSWAGTGRGGRGSSASG